MCRLPLIIVGLVACLTIFSQSPHGEGLKFDCAGCHMSDSWNIRASDLNVLPLDSSRFHHNQTKFQLSGVHQTVDCKSCHESLVFEGQSMDCVSCHTDMHRMTVGVDCRRCHNDDSWLVHEIPELHEAAGFPLLGAHTMATCIDCHEDFDLLEFPQVGNRCVNCHLDDFEGTMTPNHEEVGFSTDCAQCHDILNAGWRTEAVDHSFFPLEGGHEINDCAACHVTGQFTGLNPECITCHEQDYLDTDDPGHQNAGIGLDCKSCHSINAWTPAEFIEHDPQFFPIYSGEHDGEWISCTDCHINPNNFLDFSCVTCHLNPETDEEHEGIGGYQYHDESCLACHPRGESEGFFDHNQTDFPLTGAHAFVDCIECHEDGFEDRSTACVDCHTGDFNSSSNPSHIELNLSNDCIKCHSTEPGWSPAQFPDHDDIYPLTGAHSSMAQDCASCHQGDYNNTPNTCVGCHSESYNQSSNPNHTSLGIPTDCASCHTTDPDWMPARFDIHDQYYPLNGAHGLIANECVTCHQGDYNNTPNTCFECHREDYDASSDPNHVSAGFSTNCINCHNENAWIPSEFDHDNIYPLNGAHAAIANECVLCHQGDYSNTPNTCFGCHQEDFDQTLDPNHQEVQFSTDCMTCHNEESWQPASFDHDGQYFPIYSGAHEGEWMECIDCHTNPADYSIFTCTSCHMNPETDDEHEGIGGYIYTDNACLACHPQGMATGGFDHNSTAFPLTGAHFGVDCIECHASGFEGTSSDCASCHTEDFNNTSNPNHSNLGLITDCASCHSTEPGWSPASFTIHDQYYLIEGAHMAIANDCASCHNGDYNNTPSDCVGCHLEDYDNAMNPNHADAAFPTNCATCHTQNSWTPSQFDHNAFYPILGAHKSIENDCIACHSNGYQNTPNECIGCHQMDYDNTMSPDHATAQFGTDCATCHNQNNWVPAEFDHDGQYFPIYSGSHAGTWMECIECHTDPSNYSVFSCTSCHMNPETDEDHEGIPGYSFESNACLACHPNGEGDGFDHNMTNFPLTGAHTMVDCQSCHSSGFVGTPTECVACHQEDYDNSANPNHQNLGLATDCAACHTTDPGWTPATLDNHDQYYPLTGAHDPIRNNCADCHMGDYNNTPTDCVGCHQSDYNNSTNPNHQNLGFATDCAACHTTDPGWTPATLDNHNQYYPLTGAHEPIRNNCADCHMGDYNNTPTDCVGCHQSDYNNSTNPNHQNLGFATDCAACHTTDPRWTPATLDNHDQYYVLLGAHDAIRNDCATCHMGDYNNTPNTCFGCHEDNYNNTVDPNHQSAQFPTNCESCHNQDAWVPSTFDHDAMYFPIYSNKHDGVWASCTECHLNTSDYSSFSCIDCHEHSNQTDVDEDHEDVGAYMYESNACFSCHPTGEE